MKNMQEDYAPGGGLALSPRWFVPRAINVVVLAVVLGTVALMLLGWLGGDRMVGDEHNAIHFMKDELWDYLSTFHYGHTLKLQFWLLHELFGHSFFWYRLPAALAATTAIVCIALYRIDGLPTQRVLQALVALYIATNVSFQHFGRWGMPNYAEAILLSSLILLAILPDVVSGRQPRWTFGRLLLIAVMPWIYPATIVLLGAVTAYLGGKELLALVGANRDLRAFPRKAMQSAVPVLLGGLSLLAYRGTVPDAQWNRARGLHDGYSEWLDTNVGEAPSYVVSTLGEIWKGLVTPTELGDGAVAAALGGLYSLVAWSLAVVTALTLAIVCFRAVRLRSALPEPERSFLRAGLFFATCIAATVTATLAASLLDAFPQPSLRHLFFLFPAIGLLGAAALTYLAWFAVHVLRVPAWARDAAIGVVAVAVLGVACVLATQIARFRSADHAAHEAMFAVLRDPGNDIVFSYSPGFFVSADVVGAPGRYFMTNAGDDIPGPVEAAVRASASSGGGGRIAVLMPTKNSGGLGTLVEDYDLRLVEVAKAGRFEAIVFDIPHGDSIVERRTVDFSVALPASAIRSIRLDPTEFPGSTIAIEQIVLVGPDGERPIDLCADRQLQLVRSLRLGAGDGCRFIVGDADNTGWLAPSGLRNLPASAAPRRLYVRMTGEFGDLIRVYVDVGAGYQQSTQIESQDVDVD